MNNHLDRPWQVTVVAGSYQEKEPIHDGSKITSVKR